MITCHKGPPRPLESASFLIVTDAVTLAVGQELGAGAKGSEQHVLQDDFDNDVDALLEEGLCAPKKRRMEEKYRGDSDHPSDGETSVQPMMTKIKTVLKSTLGQ